MPEYIIAMDGGQTSTLAVLSDLEGHLLASGKSGPANHITEPGGPERFRGATTKAIEEACANGGIDPSQLRLIFMGMTGGGDRMRAEAHKLWSPELVTVVHDGDSAHAGALAGEPGVIVIGGTGSISFGKTRDGRTVRAGGAGYMIGDEGSAYWIAIEGIRAGFRALDGRGPRTTLLERFAYRLRLDEPRDIHRLLYSQQITRPQIAELAALVSEAERQGDEVAGEILVRAGKELGLLARVALRKLEMTEGPVAWVGGVFRAGEAVLTPFTEEIHSEFHNAVVAAPRYPAVVGSLLLGFKQLGIKPDIATFWNIEKSLPGIVGIK